MKIRIEIDTAADKIADCIAKGQAILDALEDNTARMPSEPQLPPGILPLDLHIKAVLREGDQ